MTAEVTIHRPIEERDRHVAVWYLHGGGLLYGDRDDLPMPYVRMFTEAGYTLICVDYPLCPETPLPQVVENIYGAWLANVGKPVTAGLFDGYFLFGRSSGAYLSLLLAREIRRRGDGGALPQPRGVLSFYGYFDPTDHALCEPVAAYAALPEVTETEALRIAHPGGEVVTSGAKARRYALYVYARQHDRGWLRLAGLTGDGAAGSWCLSEEDISLLPPLFVTASSGDEDVPMRVSKSLARLAPNATCAWVYHLPHDFDRDTSNDAGANAYRRAIDWMNEL